MVSRPCRQFLRPAEKIIFFLFGCGDVFSPCMCGPLNVRIGATLESPTTRISSLTSCNHSWIFPVCVRGCMCAFEVSRGAWGCCSAGGKSGRLGCQGFLKHVAFSHLIHHH